MWAVTLDTAGGPDKAPCSSRRRYRPAPASVASSAACRSATIRCRRPAFCWVLKQTCRFRISLMMGSSRCALQRRRSRPSNSILFRPCGVASVMRSNSWLFYVTGGFAWAQSRFLESPGVTNDEDKALRIRTGWALGAGVELPIAAAWTARLEYIYDYLGSVHATFPSGIGHESGTMGLGTVRLGLNRQFGTSNNGAVDSSDRWLLDPYVWNVHGQFTYINQGYPTFHSPYQGTNSLYGEAQAKNTTTATAYLGLRLWEGTEFYINPELDQGGGLSNTLGIAGFPSGEAQKAAFPVARLNIDRVFLRQTFGLGGEQEAIPDGPNQLAGKQDISRVTVTVGKLSVGDAFGLNTYSFDPRTQFFNWNIYGSGSYDWVMDKIGWTWGAIVDLNQKHWAFRAGYLLEPTISNVNNFDMHIPVRGQYLAEFEWRYSLFDQPGKVRILGWLNRATMGSY